MWSEPRTAVFQQLLARVECFFAGVRGAREEATTRDERAIIRGVFHHAPLSSRVTRPAPAILSRCTEPQPRSAGLLSNGVLRRSRTTTTDCRPANRRSELCARPRSPFRLRTAGRLNNSPQSLSPRHWRGTQRESASAASASIKKGEHQRASKTSGKVGVRRTVKKSSASPTPVETPAKAGQPRLPRRRRPAAGRPAREHPRFRPTSFWFLLMVGGKTIQQRGSTRRHKSLVLPGLLYRRQLTHTHTTSTLFGGGLGTIT